MTTPLSIEQAIAQEYRKADNHLLQLQNIALGILRFAASLAVHAAAFAVLILLYLTAIAPQGMPTLNPVALTTAEQQPIPFAAMPDDTLAAAIAQLEETKKTNELATHVDRATRHYTQELSTLMRGLVEVSLLIAAILGVWGNTGGFKWVYAERARERVQQAQRHAERVELVRAAAELALNRYRFYAAQPVQVDEQQGGN